MTREESQGIVGRGSNLLPVYTTHEWKQTGPHLFSAAAISRGQDSAPRTCDINNNDIV